MDPNHLAQAQHHNHPPHAHYTSHHHHHPYALPSPPLRNHHPPSPQDTAPTITGATSRPAPSTQIPYSCLLTLSTRILPLLLTIHFCITGAVVLVYTLSLQRALPRKFVVGVTITFAVLVVCLLVARFAVFIRGRSGCCGQRKRNGGKCCGDEKESVKSDMGTVQKEEGCLGPFHRLKRWTRERMVPLEIVNVDVEAQRSTPQESNEPRRPVGASEQMEEADARMSYSSELEANEYDEGETRRRDALHRQDVIEARRRREMLHGSSVPAAGQVGERPGFAEREEEMSAWNKVAYPQNQMSGVNGGSARPASSFPRPASEDSMLNHHPEPEELQGHPLRHTGVLHSRGPLMPPPKKPLPIPPPSHVDRPRPQYQPKALAKAPSKVWRTPQKPPMSTQQTAYNAYKKPPPPSNRHGSPNGHYQRSMTTHQATSPAPKAYNTLPSSNRHASPDQAPDWRYHGSIPQDQARSRISDIKPASPQINMSVRVPDGAATVIQPDVLHLRGGHYEGGDDYSSSSDPVERAGTPLVDFEDMRYSGRRGTRWSAGSWF